MSYREKMVIYFETHKKQTVWTKFGGFLFLILAVYIVTISHQIANVKGNFTAVYHCTGFQELLLISVNYLQ